MTPTALWLLAISLYVAFWLWYVGFNRIVSATEIDALIVWLKDQTSEQFLIDLKLFLEQDDGKDFVMVNLLELKRPTEDSRNKLAAYQKIFLAKLLKRAGHPAAVAFITGSKIENIGCNEDNWTAAGLVRYRSRRDLMEMILETAGSDHHALKLAALERNFAYPAAPWKMAGGPKIIVPMILALLAALGHVAIISAGQ